MNLNPTREDVEFILKHHDFEIINGIVNVFNTVDLWCCNLKILPFRFGVVDGDFWCFENELVILDGSPRRVSGDFDCSDNKLKKLIGGPTEVGGNFDCSCNELLDLKGLPKIINGALDCGGNLFDIAEHGDKFDIFEFNGIQYKFDNYPQAMHVIKKSHGVKSK